MECLGANHLQVRSRLELTATADKKILTPRNKFLFVHKSFCAGGVDGRDMFRVKWALSRD